MRDLFRKIPFYIKLPLLAGGSLMVFIGFFYGFYTKVTVLGSEFWLANPELKLLLRESFLEFFLIGVILIIVIWVLFYSDLISNLRYMNGQLATAVAKKQITVSFDRFGANDVFGDIAHHTDELFSLFNEFDGMKSSRIAMEVNTTKQLMNTISEGVLLVNTDRIVTHINHHAESMLRLIPGEILGQAISRNVSQPQVLESLDNCLDKGARIPQLVAEMSDEENYVFTMFPIKNKQRDILRALIVVRRHVIEESPPNSDA